MPPRNSSESTSEPVVDATKAAQPAAKVELRNSLWCIHTPSGRVGMINELNGGVALFHYHTTDKDGAPALETGIKVAPDELRVCTAAELPKHIADSLNAEQRADIGYV